MRRRDAGASYRSLTEYFNTRLLQRAVEESGLDDAGSSLWTLFSDDFVEQLHAVLTDDSGSDSKRAEVRARLQNAGIDTDRLEGAFVSHVTMGTHLVNCLDLDPSSTNPRDVEDSVSVIQWARNRATEVIDAAVCQLRRDEAIRTGTLDVEILVYVTCSDCGDTMPFQRLLDERRCRCETEEVTGV
jgi:hypothetical protein